MFPSRRFWSLGPALTWAFAMATHSPTEPMSLWAYFLSAAFALTSLLYLFTSGPHQGWSLVQGLLACGAIAIILIFIALIERLAVPAGTPIPTTLGRLSVHAMCLFALFLQPADLRRRGQAATATTKPPPTTQPPAPSAPPAT